MKIIKLSIACASLLLAAACASEPETVPGPNIVVILADDLGSGDPGVYNPDSKVPMPNLARLAAEGRRFTDAHSPSGVCTPTRYGLLTGRYAWRTRLKRWTLNGYSPLLVDTARVTLASLLRDRGYTTAAIGKWHLGLGAGRRTDYGQPLTPGPRSIGFDYFFGIPASLDMPPYVFVENERPLAAPADSIAESAMRRNGGGGFWRAGPISPGFSHAAVLPTLTRRAVAYIEERDPGTPFFLYLPLSAPHTPWLPDSAFTGVSGAGPYGDFAAQVDASFGAVLDALARAGFEENTLVVVTSDNGAHWTAGDIEQYGHRANGPLRGQKADVWEGGVRIPFIARWPGHIPPGTTSEEPLVLTDLMATLAAVVGADLPAGAGEDSYNLLPALVGPPREAPIREAMITHSGDGMFAVREGPWKLIEGLGSGGFTAPARVDPAPGEPAGQLYHLLDDPDESDNRYAREPEVVARLQARLDRYREQGYSVER